MENWTEIYTALCVARCGTVSTAAKELGVHRATVSRHIDTLETSLGTRLFLRHRRGYDLTDMGHDFLQVSGRAHRMLEDFVGRARVQAADLKGEVIVTTLFPLTDLILPGILEFRSRHPGLRVKVETSSSLLQLEKAEAHVALRVGSRPRHEDCVVQPFCKLEFALFAHNRYVDRHGRLDLQALSDHTFVGNPDPNSSAPFEAWLAQNVEPDKVVLTSRNPKVIESALCNGEGLGFLPVSYAKSLADLEQMTPAKPEWCVESWLVTHVDVHRTDKIQSMLACLKALSY